jgi:membrane protease YdiL (CAAX protease family)
MAAVSTESRTNILPISIFTWAVVLLVSDLPDAIWQSIAGAPPVWLIWVKFSLLAVILLVSLAWKPIQTVRPYFFLLLVLLAALEGMSWIMGTPAYQQWEEQVGWMMAMAGFQALKLAVTVIMIATLLVMHRGWKDFFFTVGRLGEAVRTRRVGKNSNRPALTWWILSIALGMVIAPLTLLFFGMAGLPSVSAVAGAAPIFPMVLLFALTNAFSEETQFRAALLGDAQNIVGSGQAIWLTATFFGFAHYFGGAPAGVPGVLIAGALGALFAWCMLGSKSIFSSWFIHFCQNVIIYAFWAINSV